MTTSLPQIQLAGALPNEGRLVVTLAPVTGSFTLQPVRRLDGDGPQEWRLAHDGPVTATLTLEIAGAPLPAVTTTAVVPLQFDAGLVHGAPVADLLRGMVAIRLSSPLPPAAARLLWPGADAPDVLYLAREGIYVAGNLPAGFYGGQLRRVGLRIPRTDQDESWLLTDFPFRHDNDPCLTAPQFVQDWAARFAAFRTAGGAAGPRTFLQAVTCRPDGAAQVKIRRDPGGGGLVWVAENLGTTLTIGGSGIDQAHFKPQFLMGETAQHWVEFKTPATSDAGRSRAGTLTLSLKDQAGAQLLLADTAVGAIDNPGWRLDPLTVDAPPDALPTYRSWLCTQDGWAAFDSTLLSAGLDKRINRPGAVAGVIHVSALAAAGGAGASMVVDAAALVTSEVSALLDLDEHELTLTVTDPFVTVTTPATWFRAELQGGEPPALRADVLPALMGGGADRQLDVAALLGKRLASATFVSTNVLSDPAAQPRRAGRLLGGSVRQDAAGFHLALNLEPGSDAEPPSRHLFTVPHAKGLVDELAHAGQDEPNLKQWRIRFGERGIRLPPAVTVTHDGDRWVLSVLDAADAYEYLIESADQTRFWVAQRTLLFRAAPPSGAWPVSDPATIREFFRQRGNRPLSADLDIHVQGDDLHVRDRQTSRGYLLRPAAGEIRVYQTPVQAAALWRLPDPARLPALIQSFAFSPVQDLGGFLDANRGLVPWEPNAGTQAVCVEFPVAGLPRIGDVEKHFRIAARRMVAPYFLPALPGVEYFWTAAGAANWRYRHSVPALDESYAEIAETQEAAAGIPGRAGGRDLTRILGTVAFAATDGVATGWLHKTPKNATGAVAIQIQQANLTRRFPSVELLLDPGESRVPLILARRTPADGRAGAPDVSSLNHNLIWKDGKVQLQREADKPDPRYAIVNNGQPLFACPNGNAVTTLDGEGFQLDEPLAARRPFAFLVGEELVSGLRATETLSLATQFDLELGNLALNARYAPPQIDPAIDLYQEWWSLHNSHGGWPHLLGFPLLPLRLETYTDTGSETLDLLATWLPQTSRQGAEGQADGACRLRFTRAKADPLWSLTLQDGIAPAAGGAVLPALDWRFPTPHKDDKSVRLARIQARLTGSSQVIDDGPAASVALEVTELSIHHPELGLLTLPLPAIPPQATLANGRDGGTLTIDRFAGEEGDFTYAIGPITVTRGVGAAGTPSGVTVATCVLKWAKQHSNVGESAWELKNGVMYIPGEPGETVAVRITFKEDTAYANEFGLYTVDDERGWIGNLQPVVANKVAYVKAALGAGRRLYAKVVPRDLDGGTITEVIHLPAGRWVAPYLIANGTYADVLDGLASPDFPHWSHQIYFAFSQLLPSNTPHLQAAMTTTAVVMRWEDWPTGDADFNDLTATIQLPQPSPYELRSELECRQRTGATVAQDWTLRLRDTRFKSRIVAALTSYPMGGGALLLVAGRTDAAGLTDSLGWFSADGPTSGFVGAAFSGYHLGTLDADLELRLKGALSGITPELSRLLLRIFYDSRAGSLRFELSGRLVLANAITYEYNGAPCHHQAEFVIDRFAVDAQTMLAILDGDGPPRPTPVGVIANHQIWFQSRNGKPDGTPVRWQAPQLLRLLRVRDFAGAFLRAPAGAGAAHGLAIEASAVFWLGGAADSAPALGDHRLPDVAHGALHVYLHSQATGRFRQTPADGDGFRAVRVSFVATRFPFSPAPVIVLDDGDPELLYDTSGVQPALRSPRRTGDAERPPLLGRRSADAAWIGAAHLTNVIAPGGRDLLPAFLAGAAATVQLPARLTDFAGWLTASPPVDGYAAATLATVYNLTLGGAPDRIQAAIVDFPFRLRTDSPPSTDSPPRTTATTRHVQLVTVSGGRILRLAEQWLPTDEDGATWGRQQLDAANRYEGAILLEDHQLDTLQYLPRRWEVDRQFLTTVPDWPLAVAVRLLDDPRRRLPSVGDDAALRLQADATLGLLLFEASPQVPSPTPPKTKGDAALPSAQPAVAATRFRLAHTQVRAAAGDYVGRLRPAAATAVMVQAMQLPPAVPPGSEKASSLVRVADADLIRLAAGEHAALTQWSQVTFEEQVSHDGQTTTNYPQLSARVLGARDTALDHAAGSGGAADHAAASTVEGGSLQDVTAITPPLVDVVAWAERPGEMKRTQWSLSRSEIAMRGELAVHADLVRQRIGPATAVHLRQPRAVAGRNESVRLLRNRDVSRLLHQGGFYFSHFSLVQVLGKTAPPAPGKVYAVAASKNNFFPSAELLEDAVASPGLFYYTKHDQTPLVLEPLDLHLLAHRTFTPRRFSPATAAGGTPQPVQVNKMTLWLVEDFDPAHIPSDLPYDGAAPDSLLIADLPGPGDQDDRWAWESMHAGSDVFFLRPAQAATSLATKLRDWAQKHMSATKNTAHLALVRYRLHEENATRKWVLDGASLADALAGVLVVAFLDSNGRIIAPKMSVTLLSAPVAAVSKDATAAELEATPVSAAGYARLDDDDFSPLRYEPEIETEGEGAAITAIEWTRAATLRSVQRVQAVDVSVAHPYLYDVVVYGPGGELIPTALCDFD